MSSDLGLWLNTFSKVNVDLGEEVTEALVKIKRLHPELRVCQIIHNAVVCVIPDLHGKDLFHVNDDVLLQGLNIILDERTGDKV